MKLFVWGTGFVAKELLENEFKDIKISGFIDKKAYANSDMYLDGVKVYAPQVIKDLEYDLIVVATGHSYSVYEQAKEVGVDLGKLFFIYNNYIFEDLNKDYDAVRNIFTEDFVNIIKNRYHVIRGMHCDELGDGFLESGSWRHGGVYAEDYVRLRTFELVYKEITEAGLKGNVAELGVYRGEFSRYLNRAFSDKMLYLFDTFEGFNEVEAKTEKESGNCGDAFINRFRETSIDIVMSKMDHPEKIIVKKGLFPESLDGLEDSFVFVSIDVDFEQSIYDGLKYFYPRLVSGGYIFVHDYNSASLMGVRKAVARYEIDENIRLCKCPITDLEGTLVITK
ncbi:MAG: hypothetical protein E7241_10205 [Lachnospiraceae bacterium]|nr:hypothetical protein [Lachnospiraceae bacterium]